MQALLSFEQAPPFSVPARFMLGAPLFGIAAGVLLLALGGEALSSRWSPATLALTHLFTAGFLLQVMIGALFQIMPVAVGANFARPLLLARVVHLASVAGAVALVTGFLSGRLVFMHAAGILLGLGVTAFLGGAALALRSVPNANPTAAAIKLALGGLAVTAGLGLALVFAWISGAGWPMQRLTDLHAGWGLLGWCAILLAGVAYVVVPMFQLTPGYSARFSRWYAPVLLAAVLTWTLLRWQDSGLLADLGQTLLGLMAAAFAAQTLNLQRRSKRSRADTTMRFWRLGMAAAIAAALLIAASAVFGLEARWPQTAFYVAALAIGGALISVVSGMLYKILPFLSWLHLQNAAAGRAKVPHMGDYLPERFMQRQFVAHAVAVGLFLLAIAWPEWLARPAGLALIVAHGLLLYNLTKVVRRYRAVRTSLPV